jgi:hypothetical protein
MARSLHSNAYLRARIRRPLRRRCDRRPVPPGRRTHVSGCLTRGGRPAVQPDRQGKAHVRGRYAGAAGPSNQGCSGFGLRVAAFDGSGRNVCHVAGLADRRTLDPVRLRRTDEQCAALRRSGHDARACRSVPKHRSRPGGRLRLFHSTGQGKSRTAGRGVHRADLPDHGSPARWESTPK